MTSYIQPRYSNHLQHNKINTETVTPRFVRCIATVYKSAIYREWAKYVENQSQYQFIETQHTTGVSD